MLLITDEYHSFMLSLNKEEANSTIEKFVNNTEKYGKNSDRLTQLADNIIEDFTDPYFLNQQNDEIFCHYIVEGKDTWGWCAPPLISYFKKDPFANKFAFDKSGRARAMVTSELSFDPYWVAYQRTGACQELSVIFNETANRAGFTVRIVHADGIGHWWNEVFIDGEWKYFDTQNYGIEENKTNTEFWFGNRSEYSNNSGFNRCNLTKCGVYVFNCFESPYGELITDAYDPMGDCIHGIYDSIECQS